MQKDATPLTSPTTGLQDPEVAHSWQIELEVAFYRTQVSLGSDLWVLM